MAIVSSPQTLLIRPAIAFSGARSRSCHRTEGWTFRRSTGRSLWRRPLSRRTRKRSAARSVNGVW